MSVAIVLQSKQELQLVHWAARLATARKTGLCLIWSQKRRGTAQVTHVKSVSDAPDELIPVLEDLDGNGFDFEHSEEHAEGTSHSSGVIEQGEICKPKELPVTVITVRAEHPHYDIEKELDEHNTKTLILPRDAQLKAGSLESQLHDHLVSKVPCEIILLTPGDREVGNCREIVTPVGEGPHSASCLRMANDLVTAGNANLVALHVEPEIDETANQAAEQILCKTVDRALGKNQERVEKRVELANNVIQGIKQSIGDGTDLIILGLKRSGLSKRFNSQGIAEKLIDSKPGPTIAVVQSAIPIASRMGRKVDELFCGLVPQLPRDKRVELVERIQSSSQWDFDFIMLICMSTIIAAGGLIQNSPAVVIGAMLVAPLMTPLLGAGLSIVQGNSVLFRSTLFTVLRGFLLAYAIGFIVAMIASFFLNVELTDELWSRGNPTILDIAVAMVGGIAAAYASGRSNLLSALPGVAIAAALVPPIATSGIAVWLGEFGLAFRSALLFFTNIVAIIVGTAVAFRATGIRATHQFGSFNRWTIPVGVMLLLMTILLGVYESMPSHRGDIESVKNQINEIAEQYHWTCTSTERESHNGKEVLTIRLASQKAIPQERLDEIATVLTKNKTEKPEIRFVTETNVP